MTELKPQLACRPLPPCPPQRAAQSCRPRRPLPTPQPSIAPSSPCPPPQNPSRGFAQHLAAHASCVPHHSAAIEHSELGALVASVVGEVGVWPGGALSPLNWTASDDKVEKWRITLRQTGRIGISPMDAEMCRPLRPLGILRGLKLSDIVAKSTLKDSHNLLTASPEPIHRSPSPRLRPLPLLPTPPS